VKIKHAKKALSVLLIGSALLLSGCTTANSAAKVGKTNISESVIENRVAAILQERKGVDTSQMQLTTGKTLNRTVLRFHFNLRTFCTNCARSKNYCYQGRN
jgi:starvation-inducible outer membrane lipoprotein